MLGTIASVLLLALLALGPLTSPAEGSFGFKSVGLAFSEEDSSPATEAGSHPFSWTIGLALNTTGGGGEALPDGDLKDLRVQLPPGLVGAPDLVPHCSHADFTAESCPAASEVGSVGLQLDQGEGEEALTVPLYNLEPLPGNAAELAFTAANVPVVVGIRIKPGPPYNLIAQITNASQVAALFGATLTVHGVLGDAPFLTLPRSCAPAGATFEADSWEAPGAWVSSRPPELAFTDCAGLGFSPTLTVRPTTADADAPSGLDLTLEAPDEGLTSATRTADADLAKAVLELPEGMRINPAVAAGLAACSEGQLAAETLVSAPGEGCPEASKIGAAEVETPLLDGPVAGSIYVAQPHRNLAGDALFAIYVVLKEPRRGILLEQAARIEPDPRSGRLVATLDGLPPLPFARLELRLREGPRGLLVTPDGCATHTATYELTPSSGAAPLLGQSAFSTDRACAPPAFAPALSAGAASPWAGAASPFVFDLLSGDREQNLSGLSLALPPGLAADLAGTPSCPDDLAATGACPGASRVGYARVAAGPGPTPLWIPEAGRAPSAVYLAGPYDGAPFSLLIVVPVQAGPFDLGAVLTRVAIRIDPLSARATIDVGPLPQIIAGVPIDYRSLRVVLDRPGFVINPTSCAATAFAGSATSSQGASAPLSDRFQVGGCAALGFKPRLAIRLLARRAHRGAHPRLRAVLRPRAGDANVRRIAVTLPGGELLENSHIRRLCTREQFAAGGGGGAGCPRGSVYGRVRAWTPLLDEPLSGPVYLRSSSHRLPDLVLALRGQVDLIAVGHVTSVGLGRGRGAIRAVFPSLPDAPLSRVVLELQGGRRGLLVNSADLCRGRRRARVKAAGHNGRTSELKPLARPNKCGKAHRKKHKRVRHERNKGKKHNHRAKRGAVRQRRPPGLVAVVVGCLDEKTAGVWRAGLGDGPALAALTGGVLGGHDAEIGHQRRRALKAPRSPPLRQAKRRRVWMPRRQRIRAIVQPGRLGHSSRSPAQKRGGAVRAPPPRPGSPRARPARPRRGT